MDRIDQAYTEGNTRGAYHGIRLLKRGYQARTKLIKDAQGRILVNEEEVINRWKEFFESLLNRPNPDDPLDQCETQTAEELIPEPTLVEIQASIKSLKNNKSPGEDGIPAELFKYGGDIIEQQFLKLFKIIWNKESKPEDWEIAVMIPIHKKGDKLDCNNYRGISLLSVAYKVFTKIIYNRLLKYTEDIIGEYQCGFRPGRSTIDHIFSI